MDERVTDFRQSKWGDELRAEWRVGHVRMCASWSGGPYVDVGRRWGHAFEVFNVWDYAKGCARIPYTRQAFGRYLHNQLADAETIDNLLVCEVNTL